MPIDVRYVVQGEIVSSDSQLLDGIQANLPDESGVVVGQEWGEDRGPETAQDGTETGNERLYARMAFAQDGTEFATGADGQPNLVVDVGSDTDSNGDPIPAEDEVLRQNVASTDIYGPQQAATQLYEAVASSALANKADGWSLKLYRSPQGAVTADNVREWYEQHPDERPTRETQDGDVEPFTPSSWQAAHHIIRETTG
jgi:hypothetical protein